MFNRVSGSAFTYNFDDGENKRKLIVKFKESDVKDSAIFKDTEFKYNLTSKMVKDLIEKKESTYKLGGKTWIIRTEDIGSPLLSKITNAFHQAGDDGIEHLEIVEASDDPFQFFKRITGARDLADAEYVKNEASVFNRLYADEYDQSMGLSVLSSKERLAGIRGKIELVNATIEERVLHGSISDDPFTRLATAAFQKYETEFTGTDYFNPNEAHYCLQVADNKLILAPRKNADLESEKNRRAIQVFKKHLISEYGENRVKKVEYAYGIDLEKLRKQGKPLTPEMVYRMNIGLMNIEADDVMDFVIKLTTLTAVLDGEAPFLLSLSLAEKAGLTHSEIRGLLRQIATENAQSLQLISNADVFRWKEKVSAFPNLTNESMASLVGVFSADSEHSLTGRRIFYEIQTQYTLADLNEYKPWIDQQELMQTFELLKLPQSASSYYETLSFVVCKKHLLRKDAEKQYAVGALIPAPPDDKGNPRYFSVTKSVHNGFGGLYYELDPLGKDTGLAKIYLFRSTTSDPYGFFSKETVSNDLNPLASIGHEGVFRIEKEIMPGINEATIPVWVGYLEQLKVSTLSDKSECLTAFTTAKKAFDELLIDQENKVPIYSFADLIKKHDFFLNDLRLLGGIDFLTFHRLAERYVQSDDKPSKWEERTDAQNLLDALIAFSTSISSLPIDVQEKTRLNSAMVDFAREVSDHILTGQAYKDRALHLERFNVQNIDAIQTISSKLSEIANQEEDDLDQVRSSLVEIQDNLTKISLGMGEDISQKKPKDLAFTGHSLGGAMSQVYSSKFVFNKNRIPCPNQKVSVNEFDGPGGSFEDNQKFKDLINKHGLLLQNLNSGIEIYHQHEVGDPAPNTGIHLGAANSMAEAASLMTKCDIKIELFKRLEDAKNPIIAQSETVHATQFLKGEEGVDYKKTILEPYSLGLFDYCEVMKDVLPEDLIKKGINLRNEVWQLALIGRESGEKLRVSPLLEPLRHFFREKDSRFKEVIDSNGNFIIDSQGLRVPQEIILAHSFQVQDSPEFISAQAQAILSNQPVSTGLRVLSKIPWLGVNISGKDDEVAARKRKDMELAGGVRVAIEVEEGVALDTMFLSVESFANQLNSMHATYCKAEIEGKEDLVNGIFVPHAAEVSLLELSLRLRLESAGIQVRDHKDGKILLPSGDNMGGIIDVELSDDPVQNSSQATVIIAGGLLANYEYYAAEAAAFLMNGVNVFFYNPRGHGVSGGEPSEEIHDRDLAYLCNYLRMEKNIPSEKILLKGSCLGGALVARCANRKENRKVNVMLDQTFAEFKTASESMAEDMVGKNVLSGVVAAVARKVFPEYNTFEEIAKMENNLCLIANEDDQLIPGYGKLDDITRDQQATNIGSFNIEGGYQQLVMLRDIVHTGPWYGPGQSKGNLLGKEQIEAFLENTNLRRDLFQH